RKIDFAIKLLREIPQDGPIEISYSGGKDSDVILRLAQMAGIPHEAIYKQTSIDPPGTTAHAKAMGATIIRPAKTFLQIVRENSYPTRFSRFCCKYLKEYPIHARAVQGIRREESTARSKRYKEPEDCRLYPGGEKVRRYLPILEWTTEDVARFIQEQGIKCAPVYYDEAGTFHPERRLGCIGCPLAADNGRGDFLKYPKLMKQVCIAADDYLKTHPNTKAAQCFNDGYELVMRRLFFKNLSDYNMVMDGGLFPEARPNAREYLSNYFNIEL
ncbi:MAG: phosphoadenosine phosphosulfate reductase family protein, partial [Clostridia bacterium]|nr:phosphoadenosine phosphosulfate reductase family protein [Clostridia bacterium]